MSIRRTFRSPLVLSIAITVVVVMGSVLLTMVPPETAEPGSEQLPALRPSGAEAAIWVLGVVVLYICVLAGVVLVRWLRRPARNIGEQLS